jgi:hypothetical protein
MQIVLAERDNAFRAYLGLHHHLVATASYTEASQIQLYGDPE